MSKKRKFEDDEFNHALTPMGCAAVALLMTGLVASLEDPKVEEFYNEFKSIMKKQGHLKEVKGKHKKK